MGHGSNNNYSGRGGDDDGGGTVNNYVMVMMVAIATIMTTSTLLSISQDFEKKIVFHCCGARDSNHSSTIVAVAIDGAIVIAMMVK